MPLLDKLFCHKQTKFAYGVQCDVKIRPNACHDLKNLYKLCHRSEFGLRTMSGLFYQVTQCDKLDRVSVNTNYLLCIFARFSLVETSQPRFIHCTKFFQQSVHLIYRHAGSSATAGRWCGRCRRKTTVRHGYNAYSHTIHLWNRHNRRSMPIRLRLTSYLP